MGREVFLQAVDAFHQRIGQFVKHFPFRSQLQAGAPAFEQGGLQLAFQGLDLQGYGGLGQKQPFRRLGDAAAAYHLGEGA